MNRRGMSTGDRKKWAAARTLADLGELTAQWIERALSSQPGYYGPADIEDPAFAPVLIALNRAGFMTTCSQAGVIEHGAQGARLEQRAAVEGFASWAVAERIETAAVHADLSVIVHDPAYLPRRRYHYGDVETVTKVDGQRFTGFGVQVPRRHIRDAHLGYGVCSKDAQDALCAAYQVTVVDPEWGRPDVLWRTLAGGALLCGRPS